MREEDYSDYYINDLVRDLTDDYNNVRKKIELFLNLRKWFKKFQAVWGYITCALFVFYGIRYLISTGDIVFPTIIFITSGVYAVAVTVLMLIDRGDSKEEKKKKKKDLSIAAKVFKYVSFAIKTAIIIITLLSLNTSDFSSIQTIIVCMATGFWMLISLAVDGIVFAVNKALSLLKEFCLREIERTKAAVKNTIHVPINIGGEALSKAGGFIKGLFTRNKEAKEDDDPFSE